MDGGSGGGGSSQSDKNNYDNDGPAPPPGPSLLHRLASGLSSLLVPSSGSGSSDHPSLPTPPTPSSTSSDKQPVPATPVDAKWLGVADEGQLPRELLLAILSFLPLQGLGAFASSCRGYWGLLVEERAAVDAQSLYRALLLREVEGELPLEEFGPDDLVRLYACVHRLLLLNPPPNHPLSISNTPPIYTIHK